MQLWPTIRGAAHARARPAPAGLRGRRLKGCEAKRGCGGYQRRRIIVPRSIREGGRMTHPKEDMQLLPARGRAGGGAGVCGVRENEICGRGRARGSMGRVVQGCRYGWRQHTRGACAPFGNGTGTPSWETQMQWGR
jgi:hypothetical protein